MENNTYLEDVAESGLAPLIVAWCNEKGPGYEFHLGEFTRDILNIQLFSPTSPYRILSDLRKKGVVNYVVVHRRQSLYRLIPLVDDADFDFDPFDLPSDYDDETED